MIHRMVVHTLLGGNEMNEYAELKEIKDVINKLDKIIADNNEVIKNNEKILN